MGLVGHPATSLCSPHPEVNGSPAVAQRMKDNLADEIVNHLVLPATGSEADSGARAPAHDSATCWLEEL